MTDRTNAAQIAMGYYLAAAYRAHLAAPRSGDTNSTDAEDAITDLLHYLADRLREQYDDPQQIEDATEERMQYAFRHFEAERRDAEDTP